MESFEPRDRGQRRLEPFDHLDRSDPAEVAGADRGEQVHADVRRRRAMGDQRLRVVLEVVGRQPVFVAADERLEEPPGATGDEAKRVRRRCSDELDRLRRSPPGRLICRAIHGAASQSTTNGAAIHAASGLERDRQHTATTAASATLPAICR